MAMATLTTRLDPIDKMRFEYFCSEVGMTCSTAIHMLVKHVLKNGQMPIISCDHIPNEETIMAMKETEDIIAHPENYKSYDDLDELFKDMDAL